MGTRGSRRAEIGDETLQIARRDAFGPGQIDDFAIALQEIEFALPVVADRECRRRMRANVGTLLLAGRPAPLRGEEN
jgi:hypothetical protein